MRIGYCTVEIDAFGLVPPPGAGLETVIDRDPVVPLLTAICAWREVRD
jgi:hypothetical protein